MSSICNLWGIGFYPMFLGYGEIKVGNRKHRRDGIALGQIINDRARLLFDHNILMSYVATSVNEHNVGAFEKHTP